MIELFGGTIPQKLKAEVDLKTIEAIMLTMDEKVLKPHIMKADFPELFAKTLVNKFFEFIPLCDKSKPVKLGELPKERLLEDPFVLVDDYFEGDNPPLPKRFL